MGGFGGDVADGEAGGTAGEAAIRNQGAGLAQARALEEGCRVEHLLHAGATRGSLVADDDDIARLNFLLEDDGDGLFLRLHHAGRPGEGPQFFLHAGGFNDGAVRCQVAAQDHESAIRGEGMLGIMDAAINCIRVELIPAVGLGERLGRSHAARGSQEELAGGVGSFAAADIPVIEPFLGIVIECRVHLEVEVASAA